MKKILSILALAASASLGYSQGSIAFYSYSGSYAVTTNSLATPGVGGTVGKTATAADGYYYALLTQAYTGAASSTISANPLTSWTFSGAMATNSSSIAGSIYGGTSTVVSGWAPGTTDYVEIVGWSAGLGTTWAQIASELQSGWSAAGSYGTSVVGFVVSGGAGTPPGPANTLFTANGISSGFSLYAVSPTVVPEPTTIALIGLGGLGLAMIRRRK